MNGSGYDTPDLHRDDLSDEGILSIHASFQVDNNTY